MGELKFRAWDVFYKKMTYEPIVSDGTDGGETSCVRINDAIDCFDGVLMQYTGLKDKNGKDIYDGDIIIVYENGNGKIKSWENTVCFKSGAFCLYNPDCCDTCKNGFGITCTLMEARYYGELEIIGNIYENPELINN